MPEDNTTPPPGIPPEIELHVTKAIGVIKDEFRASVDALRAANKSHSSKLAGILAVFGSLVAILSFFGFNQTVSKAIEKRLEELGVAALQKRADAASSQAETHSATASKYTAQIKANLDDGERLLSRLRQNLSAEELKKLSAGVPIGTIVSFASEKIPTGWLPCDGTTISRTEFPELFTIIGDTWGPGDGATTFKAPDLRGVFLRGSDQRTQGAVDPGAPRKVGSPQPEEFPQHTHDISSLYVAGGLLMANERMLCYLNTGNRKDKLQGEFRTLWGGGGEKTTIQLHGGDTTVETIGLLGTLGNVQSKSGEVRPTNVAVQFIVRAK
jgi:microcystin-dependent protein